ncbi:MAG: lysylphosphatidylglycerol synthase transmembrane domain-containing protein [Candidatus Micrarchaeota archaeon]
MNRKQLFTVANILISIVLVAALLYYVGIGDVLRDAVKINLDYLLLALIFLFVMDLVMSYRIKVLLDDMKEKMNFIDVLKCHFVGMLAADFTPARAGYFATAAALRLNYKIPSEKAMLSIFGPQIFDFAAKVILGTAAMLYLLTYVLKTNDGWMLFVGAVLLCGIIAVMLLMLFSSRFIKLFSFAEKIPLVSKIYSIMVKMQDNAHHVVKRAGLLTILIFVSWFAKGLSWYFVAKAVGITLNVGYPEPLFYFFLQPLVTMLEFVPSTTIAGLGLSEGANVLIFSLFGIAPAQAMLFALVARFKTTLLHLPAVPEALKIYHAE